MANFSPSDLVDGQAIYNEKHQSGEWRSPDSAALRVANTGALANPALGMLRTREDRAVNAYFPVRQAATDGTARAALHTGARGDSAAEAITWGTFSEPFSVSITQAENNVFSFPEMFAATQKNAVYNLIARLDAWFVAQAVAGKTQVSAGGGFGTFESVTTDDYQLDLADESRWFQNVKAMMENNLYGGNLTGIVDSQGGVIKGDLAAQGAGNASNDQFQLAGYDQIVTSSRTILDVPTTYRASGLFFETGLVGVIPWIPQKNRKSIDPNKVMDNVGDFGMMMIPELGIPLAISAYATRADASASNGSAQDVVIQYELSVDVGFSAAPVSVATESVIFSSGILLV